MPHLHVDGTATVTRGGLELLADPADQTPHHGRWTLYRHLEAGARVLLVDGPREVDGIEYWQIYPSTHGYTVPLGWAPAASADGAVNLDPFQPLCPQIETLTAAALGALNGLEALSCFGSQELTLRGLVTCSFGIADGILAGPMMNSNIWCSMDDALGLMGPVITALHSDTANTPVFTGTYEVRGHFDDPGAQECYGTPFGTSLNGSHNPGDPGAMQECRTFFVVTAAEELTNE
ncbi:MAG: hypothetical protein QOJ81_1578 [Chloroflexota bacterium]|nr:hypothetical protein [Chloroflexota bacterium]